MISNSSSSLDCLGLEVVGNADSDNVRQKNLFCQLLKVYREVNSSGGIVRPVSVLLGDGQVLDLYKLFSLVKERGGYAAVSRKGSWGFVTKGLGLDLEVLASVKLAYDKYLNDFEAWLKKTFEEKIIRNRNHGYGWSFKPFPLEMEKDLSILLCLDLKEKDDELDIKEKDIELDIKEKDVELDIKEKDDELNIKEKDDELDIKEKDDELDIREKDDELDIKEKDDELNIKEKDDELDIKEENNELELKSKKIRRFIDLLVNHKDETKLLDANNQNNVCEDVQNVHVDGDEKLCSGDKEDVEKEYNNRKRKRESLTGLLNWMKHIAKHPLVPVTPPLPKPSKWKEYKGEGFFSLLLRAREVLLLKQCVEPNGGPASLQNQRMHPSMYEDEVARDHHSTARLKCSGRHATSVKSRLCSCCKSRSADENRLTSSVNKEAEKCPPKETAKVDLLTAKIMAKKSGKVCEKGNVSIGPRYQAEVPEWTGVVSESDSKWPGTQIWPPPEQDSKPATETDLIGREREDKCSCEVIGSVQCHRFHIAENRLKLKLELGPLFYHWGFDRMGEEVSLQWTALEEKKFKDLLRSHAPIWNNTSIYFRKKKRRNLVNYYFNEFVIQLRSYQNRVTPNNIDSDDDEAEFGSFGHGFGMEALMVDDVLPECSVNKQCTDFEY